MKLRVLYLCILAVGFIWSFRLLGKGQSSAPQPPQAPSVPPDTSSLRLNVDLVVLDAQVLQKKTSKIVGGLQKADFTLFEDNVKQDILQFSKDTLPLSVILLVDRGGCLDPFGDKVRSATIEALNRLRPQDEVAVMAFATDTTLVKGFRLVRNATADALDRLPPHDERAGHCFNRAFYDAAHFMKEASNPAGRRVIIVITGITKTFDCPPPSSSETHDEVLESGAVVCGLIPQTGEQRFENGIISSAASVAGMFKTPTSSLKQFTEETGGEIFIAKPDVLDRAFETMVDHLRSRYTIGYVSSNTKRDGTYRKVKVQVSPDVQKREGDLTVSTRRGYLAHKDRAVQTH
jgi:Ca-activated chloride channel family protein